MVSSQHIDSLVHRGYQVSEVQRGDRESGEIVASPDSNPYRGSVARRQLFQVYVRVMITLAI